MFNKIIGYLLAGLAIVLPFALTIWLIYYLISTLDQYFNIESALIGLIVILVTLVIIGFVATHYIGNVFWTNLESIIIKTPFLGLIYKALKDITTAFVGTENKFSEPVMVKLNEESIYKIGFVTNKEVDVLLGDVRPESEEEEDFFLVYFPLSFSFSGDLFLVPRNRIRPINKKAKDVMQTIISGGIIKMD